MTSSRGRGAASLRRQHVVLALIGLLLLNLMAVVVPAAGTAAGAIEICAADGSVRQVLPDGSPAPQPHSPAHDGPLCPDCLAACAHGCAVACGKTLPALVAAARPDPASGDLRQRLTESAAPPRTLATARPRAQAPPGVA
jgi:hypothetical protein